MAHKSLKDVANPTQLGDATSLKAETSDRVPTDSEKGAADSDSKKPTLKETAEKELKNNKTALGDPISLKSESSSTVPTPNDLGAIGQNEKPKSRM